MRLPFEDYLLAHLSRYLEFKGELKWIMQLRMPREISSSAPSNFGFERGLVSPVPSFT